jgi:hypothetical protein
MAKHNLRAEVTDTTDDGVRTIIITVTGDADDFQFADLLAQRKIIQPIVNVVKQAALEGTSRYLQSAEDVISGVKKESSGAGEAVPKRTRKNRDDAPADDIPSADASAKGGRINGSTMPFSGG